VVDSELLSDEMNDPPLESGQGPREGEFVPHSILLEDENSRVDVESGRIVEIEFSCEEESTTREGKERSVSFGIRFDATQTFVSRERRRNARLTTLRRLRPTSITSPILESTEASLPLPSLARNLDDRDRSSLSERNALLLLLGIASSSRASSRSTQSQSKRDGLDSRVAVVSFPLPVGSWLLLLLLTSLLLRDLSGDEELLLLSLLLLLLLRHVLVGVGEVVVLGRDGLNGSHSSKSFLAFDSLLLSGLEDLFVLDSELSTSYVVAE